MLLADTCAEGSLTAAKGDINSRSILGDRTKVQKSATSPCCTVGGDMVIRKNAKPTDPKQPTHARGVYELCGGLREPILHHIYENFPRKYPNFLNWA